MNSQGILRIVFNDYRSNADTPEVSYVSLKSFYALATMENITQIVQGTNIISKLIFCLNDKNSLQEIPKLAARTIHILYSSAV